MIHYQTEILKRVGDEPTKYDFEKALYQRTFYTANDAYFSLKNKEAGELGEKLVIDYLEKYGNDDWVVIRNMWLNHNGPFEGDLILLTDHGPYSFEVKNYSTEYTYEDGVSSFGDRKRSGNPINQTIRNKINLENILTGVKVQGALMLIGVDNHVEIKSEVSEIETIQRSSLKHYIQKIVKKEAEYKAQPLNKNQILNRLERYEIYNLQKPKPLKDYQIKKITKRDILFALWGL